jgi:hypothetical protein
MAREQARRPFELAITIFFAGACALIGGPAARAAVPNIQFLLDTIFGLRKWT